jgi:hypothetical protein
MITIEMLFLSLLDVENKMTEALLRAEPTQIELQIERERF